ncbi:MAG: xanthine phosphoribosyltransferase, partial [Anaerolineae bacterium]
MEALRERIRQEGQNLGRGILKIDSFLNHQIDAPLLADVGEEIARRFAKTRPTRILTAEVSGIIPAAMTGLKMGLPVV